MDTWIYLGIALVVTGGAGFGLALIAISGSVKRRIDISGLPRWARGKGVSTTARGGADAVDLVSQSGSFRPPSEPPPPVSARTRKARVRQPARALP